MPIALDISEGLKTQIEALDFEEYECDAATGARQLTGNTLKPSEVQVCPLDTTYRADLCGRGQKPDTWKWQVNVRFPGMVLPSVAIARWLATPPVFTYPHPDNPDSPMKWRLSANSVKDHYRPGTDPNYRSKVTIDLTLTSL